MKGLRVGWCLEASFLTRRQDQVLGKDSTSWAWDCLWGFDHDDMTSTVGNMDMPRPKGISAAKPWTFTVRVMGASTMDIGVDAADAAEHPVWCLPRRFAFADPEHQPSSAGHIAGQRVVFALHVANVEVKLVSCTSLAS